MCPGPVVYFWRLVVMKIQKLSFFLFIRPGSARDAAMRNNPKPPPLTYTFRASRRPSRRTFALGWGIAIDVVNRWFGNLMTPFWENWTMANCCGSTCRLTFKRYLLYCSFKIVAQERGKGLSRFHSRFSVAHR